MRILWITKESSPDKINFYKELGNNHELVVLYEKETKRDLVNYKKEEDSNGFYQIAVSINGKFTWKLIRDIKAFVKKEKYDITILDNVDGIVGKLIAYYLHNQKIPYILNDISAQINKNKLIDWMNKSIVKNSIGYFSSSLEVDEEYQKYEDVQEKIMKITKNKYDNSKLALQYKDYLKKYEITSNS